MAKSKKSHHYHHELSFGNILKRTLAVGVPAAIVLGGVYFLTALGPSELKPESNEPVKAELTHLDRLRASAEEFSARADELEAKGEQPEKAADFLRRSMELYQEVVADLSRTNRDLSRLEVIGTKRDTLLSKNLKKQSMDCETLAKSLEKNGRDEEARKEYERAHYFQQNIHHQFPRSKDVDNPRLATLQLQINSLTAKPLHKKSLEAEQLALKAMEANDWKTAKLHLDEALDKQAEINRYHRNTTFASNSRLSHLESELVSIKSGELYLAISKSIDQAKELEANGKNLPAAESYQAATDLQLQLNQQYPQSRFASQDKIEELEISRQTAMSQDLANSLSLKNVSLDQNLRLGQRIEYAELINDLQKNLQRLQEAYPRSRLVNPNLRQKASYLALVLNDIDEIQRQAKGLLLPVPGHKASLSRSEVSQSFYRRIMGENPSRRKGDLLPVDSVNHSQAQQFCERLTWILGETITLPSEELFRAALGDLAKYQTKHIWASETAHNTTQDIGTTLPNGFGFFDLLGNVSEWLASPDPAVPDAPVIGGSCADPMPGVRQLIYGRQVRSDSNRFLGFRFSLANSAKP